MAQSIYIHTYIYVVYSIIQVSCQIFRITRNHRERLKGHMALGKEKWYLTVNGEIAVSTNYKNILVVRYVCFTAKQIKMLLRMRIECSLEKIVLILGKFGPNPDRDMLPFLQNK